MTGAPARGRALLQLARVCYGAALLCEPGLAIRLGTGRPPGRRACRIARLLGARHLIQATVTELAPLPDVLLLLGAGIDVTHAASMLMLAGVSSSARRAALTDALAESAFAATGAAVAGRLVRSQVMAKARPPTGGGR